MRDVLVAIAGAPSPSPTPSGPAQSGDAGIPLPYVLTIIGILVGPLMAVLAMLLNRLSSSVDRVGDRLDKEADDLGSQMTIMGDRIDARFEDVRTRFDQFRDRCEARSDDLRSKLDARCEELNVRMQQNDNAIVELRHVTAVAVGEHGRHGQASAE